MLSAVKRGDEGALRELLAVEGIDVNSVKDPKVGVPALP